MTSPPRLEQRQLGQLQFRRGSSNKTVPPENVRISDTKQAGKQPDKQASERATPSTRPLPPVLRPVCRAAAERAPFRCTSIMGNDAGPKLESATTTLNMSNTPPPSADPDVTAPQGDDAGMPTVYAVQFLVTFRSQILRLSLG